MASVRVLPSTCSELRRFVFVLYLLQLPSSRFKRTHSATKQTPCILWEVKTLPKRIYHL